jgi:hypothetical protein
VTSVSTGYTLEGVDDVVLAVDERKVEDTLSPDAAVSLAVITGAGGPLDSCRTQRAARSAAIVARATAVVIDVEVESPAVAVADVLRGRLHGEVRYREACSCAPAGLELQVNCRVSISSHACGGTDVAGFPLPGSHDAIRLHQAVADRRPGDAWEFRPLRPRWRGGDMRGHNHRADWCGEDGFLCQGVDSDCERARDCGRDGSASEGDRNSLYARDVYACIDDGLVHEGGSPNYLGYGVAPRHDGCGSCGPATDAHGRVLRCDGIELYGSSLDLFSPNALPSCSLTAILRIGPRR